MIRTRTIRTLTAALLAFLFTGGALWAPVSALAEAAGSPEGESLPSVDEVLASSGVYAGRTEVRDDLSAYDMENYGGYGTGEGKILILERKAPAVEFTAREGDDSASAAFPSNFTGRALEEPRVWLRCDLMALLPESVRARSLEDADILIIGEDQYEWSGTVVRKEYDPEPAAEMPVFQTPEELTAWLKENQPETVRVTRYPLFSAYARVDVYGTDSGRCSVYGYTVTAPRSLSANPEAAGLWTAIGILSVCMESLEYDSPDVGAVLNLLSYIQDRIPEEKYNIWRSLLSGKRYREAMSSMEDYYWEQASQLAELEPDVSRRANYEMVISRQSYRGLRKLADWCGYDLLALSPEEVAEKGAHMAEPDREWLEAELTELVTQLAGQD